MEKNAEIAALKQRIHELETRLLETQKCLAAVENRSVPGPESFRFRRLMADNVPDLIWAKDMDDRYIFVNKAICRKLIMCDTTEEALGKNDLFFATRERDRGHNHTFGEICVNSDQVVKTTGKAGRFIEDGFVRGRYLVLDVHKAPLFDETGAMVGSVGCGRDITRERAVEHKLRQSHEQFTAVLDHLDSAVYVADMATHEILFVNRATANQLDTEPESLIGKVCWQVFQENQTGPCRFCTNPELLDKNGRPTGVLVNEVYNKKFQRTFEIHDRAIEWPDGRMVRLEIAIDVTEKQHFLEALKKSEERFRKMADLLPIPVGEYDLAYTVTYANRAGLEWFGYTDENRKSTVRITDLVRADDIVRIKEASQRVFKGENPVSLEMHLIRQDGSDLYGITYLAPIVDGETISGVRVCFLDLTERKTVETALKQSETKYRTLFDGNNDAIFVHPFVEEGFKPFIEINTVACSRYGYSRELLRQLTMTDICRPGEMDRYCNAESRRALLSGGRRTIEVVHRRSDGREFPVEIISSVFLFYGSPMILSTVRDITDRKRHEEEKEEALKFASDQEKYALVGQVAGKMAHDFNNILMAILGHAEICSLECKDPMLKESLDIIVEQTRRGRNLTQNLVAFAKDQEPREEFFLINEKINLVINLLRNDLKPVTLVREFQNDIPEILADPGMIEHALVNLIQNSVHAMSLRSEPELTLRTRSGEDVVFIDIIDNGCGIPEHHLADIFTPSFTLKGSRDTTGAYRSGIKGTGYGMSNVKKYMDKHKGTISIHSICGNGTRVTLSIPVIKKDLTPKELEILSARETVTGKRILIVEDEPAISSILVRILSGRPFFHDIVVAPNGESALKILDAQSFDMISLDYLLPGQLNGLDVYRAIREKNGEVPVLFVSGNIEFLESMKLLKREDPLLDHLSKPCSNMVYADKVNDWLTRIPYLPY